MVKKFPNWSKITHQHIQVLQQAVGTNMKKTTTQLFKINNKKKKKNLKAVGKKQTQYI